MFEALKKKLNSWIGLSDSKKSKKTEKKAKVAKAKPKKEKTSKKKTKSEKSEERNLGKHIIEDIQKENIEIKSKEDKVEEVIKEESEKTSLKEDIIEEEKKEGFFSKLFKKASSAKLTKEQFEELFSELEITLLENNVALEAVDKIRENLSKELIDKEMKKNDAEKIVLEGLKNSILEILIESPDLIDQIKKKQGVYTIILFGINGSGKTTTVAKLANKLKSEGISVVLGAADTFRAASIEQLKIHADKISVPCISHNYGSDPAAVAFDTIKYAEKNNIKVALIDTAGRMYTKQNLLKEMEKIIRISKPDLKIFIGESITGNDAIDQAKTFNEAIGIDGIILSKADVDEKAGTILSVSQVTGKPIYFLGTGQNYKDLEVFKKDKVIKNLGL